MTSCPFQQTDRHFDFPEMLGQAVVGCLWPAAEERCGESWTALGLPLWDSGLSGLAVGRAEVYLDGSMLLNISYHLFPAHVDGTSKACCCGGKVWQDG
jgi:hypothetical protein